MSKSDIYGITDVGRKRETNEDTFYLDIDNKMCIVADGMGGHNAGEVASKKAIEFISKSFENIPLKEIENHPEQINALLLQIVTDANNKIYELGSAVPEYNGMGCTFAMAYINGNTLHTVHIGDARCYVSDKSKIIQLGDDHSYVAVAVKAGLMTKEEARKSSEKNKITMAVGISDKIEPEYIKHELQKDDTILLCSDGLWDMLSDDDIFKILNMDKSAKEICHKLVDEANNAGGKDNITVIVVKDIL
ncbi:MAG: Stp1/IreP family PP2C-type Ser/Thr phosphatase [Ignavibacteriae bacterium]|nr:Stp1/IreP family PP2C-type Ser/Thr phosphatase [Ignavibacteriota bacterium]